jgi:hypothetical protein
MISLGALPNAIRHDLGIAQFLLWSMPMVNKTRSPLSWVNSFVSSDALVGIGCISLHALFMRSWQVTHGIIGMTVCACELERLCSSAYERADVGFEKDEEEVTTL